MTYYKNREENKIQIKREKIYKKQMRPAQIYNIIKEQKKMKLK